MKNEEHHHLKWKIDNFKIKVVTFIINLVGTISLEIDKCKSKNAAIIFRLVLTVKNHEISLVINCTYRNYFWSLFYKFISYKTAL